MQLGDHATAMDVALDRFDTALTELVTTVESGGLDQLEAAEKVAVWQRFESLRNRLPLVDHGLITQAETSDLAHEYCSSTITQFLIRVLQLSPGEAAARVHAAAALAPRTSMLGERLEPRLPRLAALQRDGAVSVEKVAIVERAMHTLTRPGVEPEAVQTAEQLLAEHAPILGPSDLRRFARVVVDAADPDGPEPVDDALQHDRRYLASAPPVWLRPLMAPHSLPTSCAASPTKPTSGRSSPPATASPRTRPNPTTRLQRPNPALIARDGGCSFPGCTHPPARCDRHHILNWILGGATDLDNLTLLCRYHHSHFLHRLDLPHQQQRPTRMDPAPMDRP